MGIFDALKPKKEEAEQPSEAKAEEKPSEKKQEASSDDSEAEGKYNEPCALCGGTGTEKKWMGQFWHKKCMRRARKGAKGMI